MFKGNLNQDVECTQTNWPHCRVVLFVLREVKKGMGRCGRTGAVATSASLLITLLKLSVILTFVLIHLTG